MQPDIVLVAAERRLIDRADQLILLVDSSKFEGPSGNVVCGWMKWTPSSRTLASGMSIARCWRLLAFASSSPESALQNSCYAPTGR